MGSPSKICALLLASTLLGAAPAQAQDFVRRFAGPGGIRDTAQIKEFSELVIDTMTILATEPGLRGAELDISGTEISLTKVAFGVPIPTFGPDHEHPTGEVPKDKKGGKNPKPGEHPEDEWRFAPLVVMGYGRATLTRRVEVLLPPARADFDLTANSVQGGVGFRVRLGEWFELTPRAFLAYTHFNGEAEGNAEGIATLNLLFANVLVGWRTEILSLITSVEAKFAFPLGELVKLRPRTIFSYVHSETLSSTTDLQKLTTDTYVWRTGLTVDILLGAPFGHDVFLVPGGGYTFLEGKAAVALGTNDLFEVSLGFKADTQDRLPITKELGVSGIITLGKNIFGWSIGVIWTSTF